MLRVPSLALEFSINRLRSGREHAGSSRRRLSKLTRILFYSIHRPLPKLSDLLVMCSQIFHTITDYLRSFLKWHIKLVVQASSSARIDNQDRFVFYDLIEILFEHRATP